MQTATNNQLTATGRAMKRIALYLSSADRVSGTYSDFAVRLPRPIPGVMKLYVEEVCLPLVIYNITSACNTLTYSDTSTGPPASYTVQLEPGSYTADQFCAELARLMDATLSANTYSVSYSTRTFKFTVSTTGTPFELDAVANSVYQKMGIDFGGLTSISGLGIDHAIEGSVTTFGTPFYAYVESTVLSASNNAHVDGHYMSSNASENGKNIVLKVPITANTGGVIQNYFLSDDRAEMGQHATDSLPQRIDVRLRFPNDQPMEVMSDWSLTVVACHLT